MHTPILMEEVLQRHSFRSAHILTGSAGFHRTVRWVHVLEDDNPRQLLHGGELVLTTGVGLRESALPFERFVRELVQGNAAGLCVELGGAIREIPQSAIDMAKAQSFPLIVFPDKVHFVDITQDIHGLILSRHHRILDDLEELNHHLNKYVLDGLQPKRILDFLAKATQSHVVYQLNEEPPQIALCTRAPLSEGVIRDWRKLRHFIDVTATTCVTAVEPSYKSLRMMGNLVLSQRVFVLGSVRGSLHLMWESSDGQPDEFRTLALDRAASALSHDEFRRLSVQERQLFYEQDYVERLLTGTVSVSNGDINSNTTTDRHRIPATDAPPGLSGIGLGQKPNSVYHALLITANPIGSEQQTQQIDWVSQRIDIAISARLAFTRQQLECALSVRRQAIVGIIAHLPEQNWREQLQTAAHRLSETLRQCSDSQTQISVCVGNRTDSLSQIYQSYKRAEGMASHNMSENFHHTFPNRGSSRILFYEDTGIYKWLGLMENHPDKKYLMLGEIGSIKEYDHTHRTDLLRTLKTYLDCDRSVQRTATRLSIHRQTLYHRLRQINFILKSKLDNPQDRLSIHLALYVYESDYRDSLD